MAITLKQRLERVETEDGGYEIVDLNTKLLDGRVLELLRQEERLSDICYIGNTYYFSAGLLCTEEEYLSLETAMEHLRAVELDETHFKKKPAQLSGGEQQRVAIARALASDASILLADEPTGNLDNENSQKVVALLKDLAHRLGKCVVIVTHSREVAPEADVRCHMSDGRLDCETP